MTQHKVYAHVLLTFLDNPNRWFTLYSMGKIVQPGSAPGSRIRGYMDRLVKEGFLDYHDECGKKHYRLSSDLPRSSR